MFSMTTVDSSTRIPTASANPPSVMMLMVCPAPQRATTAVSKAKGMVVTTISALRQSRRNGRLELREIRLDLVYDAQCGGIGTLGHRNVDSPPSIHLGVTRDDVARILNRADVADKDGGAGTRANRKILQVFDIRNNGIDRREPQQVAGAYVPRWHDDVSGI